MKVCLYFEGKELIKTSGIGKALSHQMEACKSEQIDFTLDPNDDYELLHINTIGLTSILVINKARKKGCKIIYHAHSTEEDFRNSFLLSNTFSGIFKKNLMNCYSKSDAICTPTPYSKKLLQGYGLTQPIYDISNGINLKRFEYNEDKIQTFKNYFSLTNEKVIMCVGLYFERKGILDFITIAKQMPSVTFIWFGKTPLYLIPKNVREAIKNAPHNVIFPGYVKGAVLEGAYLACDCFFFPSYEETEGIVVLEALASKQMVITRDIGVYDEWLENGKNCFKGNNNEEFIQLLENALEHDYPKIKEAGYQLATERSIQNVGFKLKKIYEEVLKM